MTRILSACLCVGLFLVGCGGSGSSSIKVTIPSSLPFGQVGLGTTSAPSTISIMNSGSSALSFSTAPTLSGTNAADFSITASTCSTSVPLNAGSSCSVTITFTPTVVADETAVLNYGFTGVTDTVSVALTGTGIVAVANVLPGQVALGLAGNVNAFFVTITLCVPGTTTCQTIPNIEIDTGSSGLRLISNSVTLPLIQALDGTGSALGNCIQFADMSYAFGPVKKADIHLSGETALNQSIQLMGDRNFASTPTGANGCAVNGGSAITNASSLGANGLLGMGLFRQDCGVACTLSAVPATYYACSGNSCTPTTVSLSSQLQDPVWLFAQDNNGFIINLPAISAAGASTVQGSIIFGIDTKDNNSLGGAQVYTTNSVGNISTTYHGQAYPSFIDSGSNGLFFLTSADNSLTNCSSAQGFYCPANPVSFTVINECQNGATGSVSFTIGNAEGLFTAHPSYSAFNDIGGPFANAFDFGMPFFYGRRIFFGIEGQTTSTFVGPLYAY